MGSRLKQEPDRESSSEKELLLLTDIIMVGSCLSLAMQPSLCYTLNELDTSSSGIYTLRDPQALSNALTALGMLQPRTFESLTIGLDIKLLLYSGSAHFVCIFVWKCTINVTCPISSSVHI